MFITLSRYGGFEFGIWLTSGFQLVQFVLVGRWVMDAVFVGYTRPIEKLYKEGLSHQISMF